MVKVLCYKSQGRWLDPSWYQWIFHWHKSFRSHYGPGVDSAWQKWVPGAFPGGKGGRCVRLTTYHHPVPLSRNLGALTSWNPLGLSRPVMGLLYLFFTCNIYVKRCIFNLINFNQVLKKYYDLNVWPKIPPAPHFIPITQHLCVHVKLFPCYVSSICCTQPHKGAPVLSMQMSR